MRKWRILERTGENDFAIDELHLLLLYIKIIYLFHFQEAQISWLIAQKWYELTNHEVSYRMIHTAKQKEYSIQIIPFNFMNQPDGHQTELLSLNYFAITWLINCSKVRFWSDFNCWNGPKSHLRRELKWPKIAQSRSLKSCDHEFGRENQCTKIATPCICLHVITSFKYLVKKNIPSR